MADVIPFPGAGIPPVPAFPPDLDAIADRYTSLLEARAAGDTFVARFLEGACASDIPALQDEIARLKGIRTARGVNVLGGPPRKPRCLRCKHLTGGCTCYDEWFARADAAGVSHG